MARDIGARMSAVELVWRYIAASAVALLAASCGTSRMTTVARVDSRANEMPLAARPATGPELAAMVASATARKVGGFTPAKNHLAFALVTNNGWATASIITAGRPDVEREAPGAPENRAIIFRRNKARWRIVAFGSSYLNGAAFRKVGISASVLRALKLSS